MKKIISLFKRNYDGDHLVRDDVVEGAEWVIQGEGVATQKWDGTCCMIRDGKLYKRYEVKKMCKPPENFEPANEVDEITGKQQGWLLVGEGPEDQWHREGLDWAKAYYNGNPPDHTFELLGPKVQGNPEKLNSHVLYPHGVEKIQAPTTFNELKEWFKDRNIEGIVWHHPDGRMVKIKKKDFGLKRDQTNDNLNSSSDSLKSK